MNFINSIPDRTIYFILPVGSLLTIALLTYIFRHINITKNTGHYDADVLNTAKLKSLSAPYVILDFSINMNPIKYLFSFFLFIFSHITYAGTVPENQPPLKVQLMGPPQVQFAGFYLAQTRNFFENEGLNVELIPGKPDANLIKELQEDKVDIAVTWMSDAQINRSASSDVINIAQIFNGSSLRLLCKINRGIYELADLKGKLIGTKDIRSTSFMQQLILSSRLQLNDIKITPASNKLFLDKDSKEDCITVNSYGDYLDFIKADSNTSNIIEFLPEQFGISNIEDGIYVSRERLNNAEFEQTLIHFLRALKLGWMEARKSPALAIEAVIQQDPNLSRSDQYYMLEQVLQLIPQDPKKFGLLDINKLNPQQKNDASIWTHKIWEQLNSSNLARSLITNATTYYMKLVTDNFYYKLLVYFGVLTFALSGILEAINRSYDLYGRLFLGLLSGLGGGTLRDLLIQGDRIPFYYVKDVTYPLGILCLVVLTTIITSLYPCFHLSKPFKGIKKYADVIGFGVLSMTGAVIALSSGLPWFWAPFCAALSCSGGGVLRDIVINQEPNAFKKTIYEEPAVVGALALILGLYLAKQSEHSALPVVICILFSIGLVILMRIAVYQFNIQYPKWLGGETDEKH